MIAVRRNKVDVDFSTYKSGKEIASIYSSLSSASYKDTSLVLQTLYLLCEISAKKIGIHFGLSINTKSHSVNGYLDKLKLYNVDLGYFISEQSRLRRYRNFQRFDYDRLRFDSNIDLREYPTTNEMLTLFKILFEWLKVVERQRGL